MTLIDSLNQVTENAKDFDGVIKALNSFPKRFRGTINQLRHFHLNLNATLFMAKTTNMLKSTKNNPIKIVKPENLLTFMWI